MHACVRGWMLRYVLVSAPDCVADRAYVLVGACHEFYAPGPITNNLACLLGSKQMAAGVYVSVSVSVSKQKVRHEPVVHYLYATPCIVS